MNKYSLAPGKVAYCINKNKFAIRAEDDGKLYWGSYDDYHIYVIQQMVYDYELDKSHPLNEQEVKEVMEVVQRYEQR